MAKPYKLRDDHGLRDHTGKFSQSGVPAPRPAEKYPGKEPGERTPATQQDQGIDKSGSRPFGPAVTKPQPV